jgi:hypothetical protein
VWLPPVHTPQLSHVFLQTDQLSHVISKTTLTCCLTTVITVSVEARAEVGGALKHDSDTVHYCPALLHEGILIFKGAFAIQP